MLDSFSKVSHMLAMFTRCTLLQCLNRAEYRFCMLFITASLSCSSLTGMSCSNKYCSVSWICSVSPYNTAANAMSSASGVDLAMLLCLRLCHSNGKNASRVLMPSITPVVDFDDHGQDAKSASL